MNRPTTEQIARVKHLLEHEETRARGEGTPTLGQDGGVASASGRVYDLLFASVSPLVGAEGARLMFLRSLRLAKTAFPCLAAVSIKGESSTLRDCLLTESAATAADASVAFFSTFLALMTTFIGDRQTNQLLRGAWPTLDDAEPRKTIQ